MKTGPNLSISRKMGKDLENFRGLFSRSHENLKFQFVIEWYHWFTYYKGLAGLTKDILH